MSATPESQALRSASRAKSQAIRRQNRAMIKAAIDTALKIKASTLFIYIDPIDSTLLPEAFPKDLHVFLVTKQRNFSFSGEQIYHDVITVPKMRLGRMGLIKIATLMALSSKYIRNDDSVVFLTGKAEQGSLDTILCFNLENESEIITGDSLTDIPETLNPSVFQHALNLAIELAATGKEGKPVGTIFVLGDEEKVMTLSKQMIINPFKGYDAEERNLLNPALKETIREFSSLDGSFVVAGNGEVIAAGRYLGAALEGAELQRGLGARHLAAAGITALTNAIAIVISESTGDIRIFRNGAVVMEIEKPTR